MLQMAFCRCGPGLVPGMMGVWETQSVREGMECRPVRERSSALEKSLLGCGCVSWSVLGDTFKWEMNWSAPPRGQESAGKAGGSCGQSGGLVGGRAECAWGWDRTVGCKHKAKTVSSSHPLPARNQASWQVEESEC